MFWLQKDSDSDPESFFDVGSAVLDSDFGLDDLEDNGVLIDSLHNLVSDDLVQDNFIGLPQLFEHHSHEGNLAAKGTSFCHDLCINPVLSSTIQILNLTMTGRDSSFSPHHPIHVDIVVTLERYISHPRILPKLV